MRSIPVNVDVFAGFTCVMAPEPKVIDQATGEVRKDRRSGESVYTVGVCAMRGRDSSVIQVSVVGEPTGITLGAAVRLVELEASAWDRDGRSGVAYRAAKVLPAGGPVSFSASPAGSRPGSASGSSSGADSAVTGRRASSPYSSSEGSGDAS